MTQEATATLVLNTQPFENGKANPLTELANGTNNMSTLTLSNSDDIKTKRLSRTLPQTATVTDMTSVQLSSSKSSQNSNVAVPPTDLTTDTTTANPNPTATTNGSNDIELMNSIAKTLADFYGGGMENNNWEEPETKRVRSSVKAKGYSESSNEQHIKIRDFAFPTDDPRHWGQSYPSSTPPTPLDCENRRARALYDFEAENESELSFSENDIILIKYRHCQDWLVAELRDETGLVPENYIELLDDDGQDDSEEQEYGAWVAEQTQVHE